MSDIFPLFPSVLGIGAVVAMLASGCLSEPVKMVGGQMAAKTRIDGFNSYTDLAIPHEIQCVTTNHAHYYGIPAPSNTLDLAFSIPPANRDNRKVDVIVAAWTGSGKDTTPNSPAADSPCIKSNLHACANSLQNSIKRRLSLVNITNLEHRTIITSGANNTTYKSKDANGNWLVPDMPTLMTNIDAAVDRLNSSSTDLLFFYIACPVNGGGRPIDNNGREIDTQLLFSILNTSCRGRIWCVFDCDRAASAFKLPHGDSIPQNAMFWHTTTTNSVEARAAGGTAFTTILQKAVNANYNLTYGEAIQALDNATNSIQSVRSGCWANDESMKEAMFQ